VNLGRIGRKLRREAAANPKKAVLLGVVAIAALYLWAPLVRGWIVADKAPAQTMPDAPPPIAAAQPTETVPTNQAAANKTTPVQPSWQQVVQWMPKDPRTMIAPMLTQTRDPFESLPTEAAERKAEDKIKTKPPVITPAAAGLVLTSTIIGPQRRVAQISGKTYTVGQVIEVAKEKESPCATFKLIEVHPRRAILEAEGERFELTIPEPGKSGKIEFLGAAGSRQ
jgi:hypothetical protein